MDKVKKVLNKLQSDYLRSPERVLSQRRAHCRWIHRSRSRYGAIDFFPLFLNSVLKCLGDNDNKVRYYSSETLYNIAKAAQAGVLEYFDQFFYALCQLFSDVDTDVRKISFPTAVLSP